MTEPRKALLERLFDENKPSRRIDQMERREHLLSSIVDRDGRRVAAEPCTLNLWKRRKIRLLED